MLGATATLKSKKNATSTVAIAKRLVHVDFVEEPPVVASALRILGRSQRGGLLPNPAHSRQRAGLERFARAEVID
jgi:hypothetical protein